jgi:hypothetical protein
MNEKSLVVIKKERTRGRSYKGVFFKHKCMFSDN